MQNNKIKDYEKTIRYYKNQLKIAPKSERKFIQKRIDEIEKELIKYQEKNKKKSKNDIGKQKKKKAKPSSPTAKEIKTSEKKGAKSSGKAKKGQQGKKSPTQQIINKKGKKPTTTTKKVIGLPFPKKSEAEKRKTRRRQEKRAAKKAKSKKKISKPTGKAKAKKKKGKKQPAKITCKYRYHGKCLSNDQMKKVVEIYRRLQGIGIDKKNFKKITGGKRIFASYQLIIDTIFDYVRYYLGLTPDEMPIFTDKQSSIIKVAVTLDIRPDILSSDYIDARNNVESHSRKSKINTIYVKPYDSDTIKLIPKSRFQFIFELLHDKIQQHIREECEIQKSEKCSPRIEFEQAIEPEFTKIVYFDFNKLAISGVDQDIIESALEETKEDF
jgi:hypothetical protein